MMISLTEVEANWILENIRTYKEGLYYRSDYSAVMDDWNIEHFDAEGIKPEEFAVIKALYEKLHVN